MMEKVSVKGNDMTPLYQWLTEKSENGIQDAPVTWNFQKFLIDENGNWAGVAAPKESCLGDHIVNWIKGAK
jgi:glutathione peroxidase